MVCCVGKEIRIESAAQETSCASRCEAQDKTKVAVRQDFPCKCKLSPALPVEHPDSIFSPSAVPDAGKAIVALPGAPILVVRLSTQFVSGITGIDSGPPIQRPKSASFGRAPPVFLA